MSSREIFRHTDEDDDTVTLIRDRQTYIKLSVNGPTSFTFIDPADVVRLRDALTEAINTHGWTA